MYIVIIVYCCVRTESESCNSVIGMKRVFDSAPFGLHSLVISSIRTLKLHYARTS